ncbi:hypothetical protein [Bacillus chungangensis]|uniref:Uncharacterized protein n=1 Tax=Bacillus chungangensis TaxID=587633 RepID=A0ABT9WMQ2_9BACI|nr:hypothetical protein [Bacillus chungangensis]MDQ0174379.1 hypothetical protein [Bacillus chungangensis]
MAKITDEIEAIGAIISGTLPDATIKYQHLPEKPTLGLAVIQYVESSNTTETAYHYRIDRTFRLLYYGQSEVDCLRKFELIEEVFGNTLQFKTTDYRVIPKSFGASQPFKTEGGAFCMLATLQVELRQARPQEKYEKIGVVEVETNGDKTKTECGRRK